MIDFTELDILPEQFDTDVLERIPDSVLQYSEMHEVERRFVNGLIRLSRPKNILEIGVSGGAGSSVILNAISDMPESHLSSYDILDKWYMDTSKDTGFVVSMMWPNGNRQWSLHTGKDVSECVDEFENEFDFVIIDTAHVHPVESLNFLSVLPYLTNNAIVVFHDIALFTRRGKFDSFPNMPLANKLVYDTIVGEKMEPGGGEYLKFNRGIPSIGSVQISDATRRYIDNVFNMLYFPWSSFTLVYKFIFSVAKIVKRHYPKKEYEKIKKAIFLNARLEYGGWKYDDWDMNTINAIIRTENIIVYGAGQAGHNLIMFMKKLARKMPVLVLDVDPSKNNLLGIPVKRPDFAALNEEYKNVSYVVAISKSETYEKVREKIISNDGNAKVYNYKDVYPALIYEQLTNMLSDCQGEG